MKIKFKAVSRKKRINWLAVQFLVFIFAFLAFTIVGIFIPSYNSTLASQIQKNDEKILTLNESINATSLTIKELSTRERIVSIVSTQGLTANPDNVVAVQP